MDITKAPRHITRTGQHDAPKSAPIIPRHMAATDQYTIIRNWKPQSDVWPLIFGRGILIGAATCTGIYINQRFRGKLKLRDYGTFPTLVGLSAAPAVAAGFSHSELVLNKLLLLEIPCPLCIESRSALVQICSGLLLPLVLAPIANFSIAAGSGVYNVPYVTDVRRIFKTILSVYQPLLPKIAMIFTFHALLAGFITYLEIKSFLRLLDLQYLIQEEKEQKLQ